MWRKKSVSKGYKAMRKTKSLRDKMRLERDKEWSAKVKELAGHKCELIDCGSTDRLNSHHIFTRSNKSVRWDTDNGVCLCSGHHIFFAHKRPHEFGEWIRSVRGLKWWDNLVMKKNMK